MVPRRKPPSGLSRVHAADRQAGTPRLENLTAFEEALSASDVGSAVLELHRARARLAKRGAGRDQKACAFGTTLAALEIVRTLPVSMQSALHETINANEARTSRSLLGALRRATVPSFEADAENERKNHNLEVQALSELDARGIAPEDVIEEAGKPGAGPTGWARAFRSARAERAAQEAEAAARALGKPPPLCGLRVLWGDEDRILGLYDLAVELKANGRPTSAAWGELEKFARRQQAAERRAEADDPERS